MSHPIKPTNEPQDQPAPPGAPTTEPSLGSSTVPGAPAAVREYEVLEVGPRGGVRRAVARTSSGTVASARWIATDSVSPSGTNPRSEFNEQQLAELTDSVRRHGVLQPIVVREFPDGPNRRRPFEVVCGHRRLEAARLAGLAEVPAVVRVLEDVEVLEIQLVENLQRADVHPLDEAEGYWQLHKAHGYTVEDLAIKVGKSKAYVYARLKLRELPIEARKLWHQGLLTPSTALLVARIPDRKLAAEAAAFIAGKKGHRDQPMSFRDAAQFVQDRYMLLLKEAPFPVQDAGLLPKAGACGDCPKRTGNQQELFGDIKSADVCTDPICYRAKVDAWGKRRLAEASARGLEILPKGEAKQIFQNTWKGTTVRYHAPYVLTGAKEHHNGQFTTLKRHLGKHAPPPILATDPETGEVHELWRKGDVQKALVAAGKLTPAGRTKASPQEKAAEAQRKLEAKIHAQVKRELLSIVIEDVQVKREMSAELLRGLALCAAGRAWSDTLKEIGRRRGVDDLVQAIQEARPEQLRGWLVEILVSPFVEKPIEYNRDMPGYRGARAIIEALEIDRQDVEERVAAEVQAGAEKTPRKKVRQPRTAKSAKKEGQS